MNNNELINEDLVEIGFCLLDRIADYKDRLNEAKVLNDRKSVEFLEEIKLKTEKIYQKVYNAIN